MEREGLTRKWRCCWATKLLLMLGPVKLGGGKEGWGKALGKVVGRPKERTLTDSKDLRGEKTSPIFEGMSR